jgi:two-component system NtrC family sensor kinase
MTIRGKVLLVLTVALGLVGSMGIALHVGASRGRLMRTWGRSSQEQRFLYSQLRGDGLVFLGDLQRVHGSGAVTEAVLNGYLRRVEGQLARLRQLADEEMAWVDEPHVEEKKHIDRLDQALHVWAVLAEERVRKLPSGIGSDGAHPQVSIQEFSRDVEPILKAALEMEQEELERLDQVSALAVLLALVLTILVPMNRQLQELLAAAARIGRGDFQTTVPEKGRDEFCLLARAINQMAQELRTSQTRLMHSDRLASLGRTVASVGHEINNPLTYVISNLAYAYGELSHTRGELPEKQRGELLEALDEAREGAERVRFIAQDLKALTRADDASARWGAPSPWRARQARAPPSTSPCPRPWEPLPRARDEWVRVRVGGASLLPLNAQQASEVEATP